MFSSYRGVIAASSGPSSIQPGAANDFTSPGTANPGSGYVLLPLTETTALLSYISAGAINTGEVGVLTLNGETVTLGTPATFQSAGGGNVQNISGGLISSTRALLTFGHAGSLKGLTVDIVGGTTAAPNAVTTSSLQNPARNNSSSTIVSSSILAVSSYFRTISGPISITPITLSGTTVSFSSLGDNGPTPASATSQLFGNSCELSPGVMANCYVRDNGTLVAFVSSYTASSVSPGSERTIDTGVQQGNGFAAFILKIDSSTCIIFYGTSSKVKAAILPISGTTINTPTLIDITSEGSSNFVAVQMSGSFYLVAYQSNSGTTRSLIASVSNTSASLIGQTKLVDSGNEFSGGALIKMTPNRALLFYQKPGTSNGAGRARVLTI